MPRARIVRVAAIVSAVLIGATAWVLGSPLFIRTTANEAFPTAAVATAPSRDAVTIAPVTAGPTCGATPDPATTMNVLQRGELQFVDALHNGRGTVLHAIVSGRCPVRDEEFLRFENVAITNAPDVHVYLSKDRGGKWSEATSLYLGPLKATNGSFNYDIPAPYGQQPYGSVIVWCRAFSVLVTWADLGPP